MRPSKDEYFIRMAELVATRGTCLRRRVGCVLVSARGHVLSTGYNGPPAGRPHCNEEVYVRGAGEYLDHAADGYALTYPHACPGAFAEPGTRLDECFAVHAEQNALLQCRDAFDIDTAYITVAPCITCTKLFLNTSTRRLVVGGDYTPDQKVITSSWWDREIVVFGL